MASLRLTLLILLSIASLLSPTTRSLTQESLKTGVINDPSGFVMIDGFVLPESDMVAWIINITVVDPSYSPSSSYTPLWIAMYDEESSSFPIVLAQKRNNWTCAQLLNDSMQGPSAFSTPFTKWDVTTNSSTITLQDYTSIPSMWQFTVIARCDAQKKGQPVAINNVRFTAQVNVNFNHSAPQHTHPRQAHRVPE